MGKHRYRQLKIPGSRKPYKHNAVITESMKKANKIKTLQRYQDRISNAQLEALPQIIADLYSYLIKKSIISINEQYIKNELIAQIDQIIDSYKHSYNPEEFIELSTNMQKFALKSNFQDCTPLQVTNSLSRSFKKNFYAIKYHIDKLLK